MGASKEEHLDQTTAAKIELDLYWLIKIKCRFYRSLSLISSK